MKDYFFIESLGPLFRAVQRNKIFKDSKYFVDCIPKGDPQRILEKYEEEKETEGFDLKKFVSANFTMPGEENDLYRSEHKPVLQHLNELWDVLTRQPEQQKGGTLIALPYPYVVPGGRFREIYYWDSYFTMLGLQASGRIDLIEDMVMNFAWLIDQFGFIPNGNRTYYLGRSQPPFFSLMVELLAKEKGKEVLREYFPQLLQEYRFWMDGEDLISKTDREYRRVVLLNDGSILNRYWDDRNYPRPEAFNEDSSVIERSGNDAETMNKHLRSACESGWDFCSRWLKDGRNMITIQSSDMIPVDLNCLLYHLESVLAEAASMKGENALKTEMENQRSKRIKAINKYCWDGIRGYFFDYDHIDNEYSTKYSLAAVYPLFFKLASMEQAQSVAKIIGEQFLFPGGLVTTPYNTGQQWDYPNGWAPLQWMAYRGLKKYEINDLAETIGKRWTAHCEKVYESTGKMTEKYDVVHTDTNAGGGEYPNQDGFGWTNGVYLKMIADLTPNKAG